MDRGAWWATVHNVTQSQTRLKQLSRHTAGKKYGWREVCVFKANGTADGLDVLSDGIKNSQVHLENSGLTGLA